MNCSLPFFNFSTRKMLIAMTLVIASIANLVGITPAHAQTVLPTTSTPPVTTTPTFAPALSFEAYQMFAGVATGQNAGGDGKGTVQTIAQGLATMTLDGSLAANTNPECGVPCNLSQNVFKVNAVISTGAVATNQGSGNNPVSSMIGGNSLGIGGMRLVNIWTPPPAQ